LSLSRLRSALPVLASIAAGFLGALALGGTARGALGGTVDRICFLQSQVSPVPQLLVDQDPAKPFHRFPFVIGDFLVKRGDRQFLVDSGFGNDFRADYATIPIVERMLLSGGSGEAVPTVEALAKRGLASRDLDFVFLTHVHWDHAGGLRDLKLPVKVASVEWQWALPVPAGFDHGRLSQQLPATLTVDPFGYEGPPLLGFAASHDLFGDGAAIAVPLPGHTPGHAGLLLRLKSGKRVLLAGDAAFTGEGASKGLARTHLWGRLVDWDRDEVGRSLARLQAAHKADPQLQIVPGHAGDVVSAWPAGCLE
jgi:glyoxylase-like metal-dependent hydrolase (beta-lactamase superfamily II)